MAGFVQCKSITRVRVTELLLQASPDPEYSHWRGEFREDSRKLNIEAHGLPMVRHDVLARSHQSKDSLRNTMPKSLHAAFKS